MALWEGDLSRLKVYGLSLSYAERKPLTSCNHFIQLYRALDTPFSEYYYLLIILITNGYSYIYVATLSIIVIIITSTSDLQPSTAIANQLPGH